MSNLKDKFDIFKKKISIKFNHYISSCDSKSATNQQFETMEMPLSTIRGLN